MKKFPTQHTRLRALAVASALLMATTITACGDTNPSDPCVDGDESCNPDDPCTDGDEGCDPDDPCADGDESCDPDDPCAEGDEGCDPEPQPAQYTVETRTLMSSGVERTYLLAMPEDIAPDTTLPLVFVLHGDGGSAAGIRSSLGLEAAADGNAIFIYPESYGTLFEYYSYAGRERESSFVRNLVTELPEELPIDTRRVFLAGFSGGATMANALACWLGYEVVRGVGIHSGTLYPVKLDPDAPVSPQDFIYEGNGGVTCHLPDAIFVWGKNDNGAGTSFANGEGTKDNYRYTQGCDESTSPSAISPCVSYDGCEREVVWCPVEGLSHQIWSSAANAMWTFFSELP